MPLIFRQKRFWFILLAPLAAGITSLAKRDPRAVEHVYSTGIYPVLAGSVGRLFGCFPCSVVEWLVLILPLCFIAYIILSVRKILKNRDNRRLLSARLFATLFCIAGTVWFSFTAFCGLNYHRESFADLSGLAVRDSSAEELAALCIELAEEANRCADMVARDEENVMVSSFANDYDLAAAAAGILRTAGGEYPVLAGFYPRAKPVVFSRVMSRLNLSGIFIPFTFEANANTDVPPYLIPSSMAHELAHFKGFMREDEANFIAYVACRAGGSADFAYSGAMMALVYSTNALYSADRDAYWKTIDMLGGGVLADFNANAAYWKQFEGPMAEVSEAVNDVYLKTNSQPAGVKSYGRMVDLLLAEYRQRHMTDEP